MKIYRRLKLSSLIGLAATVFLFTKFAEFCNEQKLFQFQFTIYDFYGENNPEQKDYGPIWSNSLGETHLLIGIPTVKRAAESYLKDTLSSIKTDLKNFKESETFKISIVLFAGKSDEEYFDELKEEYQDELGEDFAVLMAPDDYYHEYFDKPISPTFGDSVERMSWRTMQALDYIFLWENAMKFPLYLQLEDDVQINAGFFNFISNQLKSLEKKDWFSLEFSPLGFIGKLFKSESLQALTHYSKLFFDVKPIDWIYWSYIRMKVCSPEWDKKKCQAEIRKVAISCTSKTPLLSHIGSISSLDGKVQHLVERAQGNPDASKIWCTDNINLSDLEAIYKCVFFLDFNFQNHFRSSKTIEVVPVKDKKTTIKISFRHLQSPKDFIFYHGTKAAGQPSSRSQSKIPTTTRIFADVNGEGWKDVLDFSQCYHGAKTTNLGVKTTCSMSKYSSGETIINAFKIEVPSGHEAFLLHKIDIHR
ncbi:Oidioi.mRNA.OKI2018_I69.chr1.g1222.t1.cds [Oikopleura dioica]|uniref:Oidioi.mRNA.OKI2018_I69.chr1.g1222.t1.cds n=1 Tax=Oikopleura dioica TaxID=34765 RepID=A0ABN7SWG6_OIKDI|nr:Oidioi.mRNA.OKI2018_I69.chr1.g1222.t1.cds [Oikopleura dioica]